MIHKFCDTDIDWMTNTTERSTCHISQVFTDAVRDAYLHQHVSQPTRYRHGQITHVLDLILASDEHMINRLEHHAGLGVSDHVVMSCNLSINNLRVTDGKSRFNYNKGNYEEIINHLEEVDWPTELQSKSTEEAWEFFAKLLDQQMTKYIPKSTPKKEKNENY